VRQAVRRNWRAVLLGGVALAAACALLPDAAAASRRQGAWPPPPPSTPLGHDTHELHFGTTRLLLSYAARDFTLAHAEIVDWVLRSARATATFFGRFPVSEVRITLHATNGGRGVMEGLAWTTPGARIRLVIGRETSARVLRSDSTLVHEMTHLGFPDLDDTHLWLHEGIATYVESIASAQANEITPVQLWRHFVEEMPQGLPEKGDNGLDDTPSEDRRYWGGAMFCLVADVEIRRRTGNRRGLKDALRAILDAGGTLATMWEVERALGVGDAAVGVPVLQELYAGWKDRSVAPDLDALWAQLGVDTAGERIRLLDTAPLAAIRRAITEPPQRPLLLVGPRLIHDATQPQ